MLDESHPSINRLTGCLTSEEILNICDVKGDDDLQVYRLNNDKAMAWLKAKVMTYPTIKSLVRKETLFLEPLKLGKGVCINGGVFSHFEDVINFIHAFIYFILLKLIFKN